MLETAFAQLRFAVSLLSGRSFSPWSLEQLVKALRATADEFGTIGAGGSEMVSGPTLDDVTREEMQLRRLRAQAVRAKDTAYYAHLFAELGLDPSQIKSRGDITRIPITGKDSVRGCPDAFVRSKSQPYLRALTTGTTGRPTGIAFSSQELRVYCALQAISHLLSGDIRADDVVLVGVPVVGRRHAVSLPEVGAARAAGDSLPARTAQRPATRRRRAGRRD